MEESKLKQRIQHHSNEAQRIQDVVKNKRKQKREPIQHQRLWRMDIVLRVMSMCVVLIILMIWLRYGAGKRQYVSNYVVDGDDGDVVVPFNMVEVVAALDLPPGNIAVSHTGRVFFTYLPQAAGMVKLAEMVDGVPVPYPPPDCEDNISNEERHVMALARQTELFNSPLGVRIDSLNRLWVLDHGYHGWYEPILYAFFLRAKEERYDHDTMDGAVVCKKIFPRILAPMGSMFNDMTVDPNAEYIYIADASVLRKAPAIVVYEVASGNAWRTLSTHTAVMAKPLLIKAPDNSGDMAFFLGVIALRTGVNPITLDRVGEWLYFAAEPDTRVYRIPSSILRNRTLTGIQMNSQIEIYSSKPSTASMTMDDQNRLYFTNFEFSAITRMDVGKYKAERPVSSADSLLPLRMRQESTSSRTVVMEGIETLIRSQKWLHWPDGISFGPDNYIYVACSAFHKVFLHSAASIDYNKPYYIYRFRTSDTSAAPGQ